MINYNNVDDCAVCPFDWMVTYNNDDYLKQKYKDFDTKKSFKLLMV